VYALHLSGVKNILAFCSVGSLKTTLPVGTLVLPDDYFCLWNQISFFEDARSHISPTIDTDFRKQVGEILNKEKISYVNEGTYVQTTGPRFETKAEVRYLATVADIVGNV
jgi:purine nucleoside phosphorylase